MAKKPQMVPAYPITDEQIAEFKHLVGVWQRRLHLMNWRMVKGRARPVANLAQVRVYPEHRLVRYAIGRDWGSDAPDETAMEKLVVHELLHVRLNQLLEICFKRKTYDEQVQGEEHDVIVVFEEVLVGMSREIESLKKQLAEAKKGSHAIPPTE
jgi:hypothetical protein